MPHITVEYTKTIDTKILKDLREIVSNTLNRDINACEARGYKADIFYAEDFVHITIKIKKGRSDEMIANLLNNINEYAKQNISYSTTVEIAELSEFYA